MGSRMIITAQNGLGVVSVETLMESLRKHFPDAKLTFIDWSKSVPLTCLYDISVEPASETSFTVSMLGSGRAFSVDGIADQNNMAAVAVREALDTTDQVIAVESGGAWFVDLVPGMRPEDVEDGQRPWEELSVPEPDGS